MSWQHGFKGRPMKVRLTEELCITSSVARRYVVVTRPVRQGRLKLALEEVLSMTVDTPSSRSAALSGILLSFHEQWLYSGKTRGLLEAQRPCTSAPGILITTVSKPWSQIRIAARLYTVNLHRLSEAQPRCYPELPQGLCPYGSQTTRNGCARPHVDARCSSNELLLVREPKMDLAL